MVIDIEEKLEVTIDKLTERAISANSQLSVFGNADTKDLARLKKLCMQYLEYPLVQALNEDT